MRRKFTLALLTLGSCAALASLAFALLGHGNSAIAQVNAGNVSQPSRVAGPQPDTSSPNWKPLSDDVGIMIRHDDRLGLRARLYVRDNGVWAPVAIDGATDIVGVIPVR